MADFNVYRDPCPTCLGTGTVNGPHGGPATITCPRCGGAAKATIYEVLDRLTSGDSGKGVIMVSSYIPELLGVCDRIAVVCRGRLGPARPVEELDDLIEIAARQRLTAQHRNRTISTNNHQHNPSSGMYRCRHVPVLGSTGARILLTRPMHMHIRQSARSAPLVLPAHMCRYGLAGSPLRLMISRMAGKGGNLLCVSTP